MKNNEQAIRETAYFIWQNAGCPQGQDEYFWSMAVEQLNSSNKSSSKAASAKSSCAVKKSSAASCKAKSSVAKKSSK